MLFISAACLATALVCPPGARAQTLSGHVPAEEKAARAAGRLEPGRSLDLAISLALPQPGALQNLVKQLYTPASPLYRHFLAPAEFARQFSPSAADYQAVIAFAQTHRLQVTGTHANRLIVDVRAPVTAIEQAFHLNLLRFERPDGSRFFAPDRDPAADLGVPLAYIRGLDDAHPARPLRRAQPLAAPPAAPLSGSGPQGLYRGYDFRNAYAPGVSLTGAGQAVALLELDTYYPSDVAAYVSACNLPSPAITNVYLDTFNSNSVPGSGNDEVTLDIDMALSMAPAATAAVYMGSNVDDVLNRIATDGSAAQISSSWDWSPVSQAEVQIFSEYAAQGQSFFQASGDSGAYVKGRGLTGWSAEQSGITVVGGTALSTSAGAWSGETTWGSSGGGTSTDILVPSYQSGISMAANGGSTSHRNIPDVAAIASNIWIVADNGSDLNIGGTSCAAPLWAAFTALANQEAANSSLPPVGFANPPLYNIASSSAAYAAGMHDIADLSKNGTFQAVAGYDLCTGWGSPAGQALINDLALGSFQPSATPTREPTRTSTPTLTFTRTRSSTATFIPSPTLSPTLTRTSTPSPSPTTTASPTASLSPSPTSSTSPSPTFTASPSQDPSPTVSASPEKDSSPTLTAGPSQDPSPTVTDSRSLQPSATATHGQDPSPTVTDSQSLQPSATATPGQDPSPTATDTAGAQTGPGFPPAQPWHHLVSALAPAGQPVCLDLSQPMSSEWRIYDVAGEEVDHLVFGPSTWQCWNTAGMAEGIYLLRIQAARADGRTETYLEKAALLR